jgi:regulator of sigma E protease
MSIFVLVVGLVLFIFLIIIHEMGHFLVAERNGVKAEEFGIFFPPRLYKRRTKKGWLFSINALPLGGFVKLKGEHDTDSGPGSYGAASTWAKAKIMAAGVLMNLVAALVLLTILAWIGLPQLIPAQFKVSGASHVSKQEVLVTYVQPGSPAANAGIKQEDQIVAIGIPGHPQTITDTNQLFNATKSNAGKTVDLIYRSNGVQMNKQLTLLSASAVAASLKTSQPKGYLGVSPAPLTLRQFSWWGGPAEAVGLSLQVIKLTFVGLGHALAGLGRIIAGLVTANTRARQAGQKAASSQVAGPVGIFVILKDGSVLGYQYMLFIIAIVSLTLAIMNILPIPALDGGRLWLMLISRGVGRQLSASVEEVVNAVGMLILMALIVLITLVDVHRFF